MGETRYDLVVIGGGVTGAGAALDAATRGLSVALVEMQDFAAGTSSRSGKLIHGGLRYLEQLELGLVREALRERRLLLEVLCPHLVRPLQFLYPLRHRWERAYVGTGLMLYDSFGESHAVPRHGHLTKRALRRVAPALDDSRVVGAMTFYDAQIDDARHTVELIRTAAAHGADVAAGVRVTGFIRDGDRVAGVLARDMEHNRDLSIRADHVINATGVWSEAVSTFSGAAPPIRVRAAKGVHIMVPRECIESELSLFLRAEDGVLFARRWGRHWLVGTTDTAWDDALDDPRASGEDIDYLLRNLNRALRVRIGRADIDGVFAGLRPLVSERRPTSSRTSRLSRNHLVRAVAPGATSIAGGKYTTYRVMARDAVDAAARDIPARAGPCVTDHTPTLGARDLDVTRRSFRDTRLGARVTDGDVARLLGRYGSLVGELDDLATQEPELLEPIPGAPGYLAVEAVYAVTHEGAQHLDDVLTRRTHIAIETSDRGAAAAHAVAAIIAPRLGWDAGRAALEAGQFRTAVAAQEDAAGLDTPRGRLAIAGVMTGAPREVAE